MTIGDEHSSVAVDSISAPKDISNPLHVSRNIICLLQSLYQSASATHVDYDEVISFIVSFVCGRLSRIIHMIDTATFLLKAISICPGSCAVVSSSQPLLKVNLIFSQ